jgi:hypothetical protein
VTLTLKADRPALTADGADLIFDAVALVLVFRLKKAKRTA